MASDTYRAVQITSPGKLELVQRELVAPPPGQVRIRVHACGVCHSDVMAVQGLAAGMPFPRVPGHELVGTIDAVGEGVVQWKAGQRVGVGWNGGYCGHCQNCRRGDLFACITQPVTGITYDGGYAEVAYAPASAVAAFPEAMDMTESAPLLCAGVTTFNALRNSGARGGDLVAILGLGGLGHLATQYAAKMGFRTVAIARGKDKEPLAKKLGASIYLDSTAQNPAEELQKLGGAKVILATVTAGDAMSAVEGGIGVRGTLVLLGAADAMQVSPLWLLMGNRTVKGHYSGTSIDSEDTLNFSSAAGVQSMNEIYPLEKAPEAYERMLSGKARFRVVLKMN